MFNTPQKNRALIAANTPLVLTADEIQAPHSVFSDVFMDFGLEECREILALCLGQLMCQTDEVFGIDVDREIVWTFFQDVERLIEASFILNQDRKGKKEQ